MGAQLNELDVGGQELFARLIPCIQLRCAYYICMFSTSNSAAMCLQLLFGPCPACIHTLQAEVTSSESLVLIYYAYNSFLVYTVLDAISFVDAVMFSTSPSLNRGKALLSRL